MRGVFMKYLIALLFSCIFISCSHVPYPSVRPLTYWERLLAHEIIREANRSNRKDYYLSKLQALLNTSEAPSEEISKMISVKTGTGMEEARKETSSGAEQLSMTCDEYTSIEEVYESSKGKEWKKYRPTLLGSYFQVSYEDMNDIFVHIRIHLYGNEEQIKNVIAVEDNIEKHMSLPGFNVNIEFVGFKGEDVFDIEIDPTKWPTSLNWSGGDFNVYAHELFHIMGLPDEYDYIENHATNKYLPIKTRLELFLVQMNVDIPSDAKEGIMCYQTRPPLVRQVCASVGLKEECVQARTNKKN